MTDMNRRQFLKGLFGTAAVLAIAVPELAKANPYAGLEDAEHVQYPVKQPVVLGIDHGLEVDSTGVTVYIDGAGVRTGDQLLITSSANAKDNGVYEITAVAKDGSGEVTLAHVHEGLEVRMHRDELEPYLNREIRRHTRPQVALKTRTRTQIGVSPGRYDNFHTGHPTNLELPPKGPRGGYTWPTPRRSRRRARA